VVMTACLQGRVDSSREPCHRPVRAPPSLTAVALATMTSCRNGGAIMAFGAASSSHLLGRVPPVTRGRRAERGEICRALARRGSQSRGKVMRVPVPACTSVPDRTYGPHRGAADDACSSWLRLADSRHLEYVLVNVGTTARTWPRCARAPSDRPGPGTFKSTSPCRAHFDDRERRARPLATAAQAPVDRGRRALLARSHGLGPTPLSSACPTTSSKALSSRWNFLDPGAGFPASCRADHRRHPGRVRLSRHRRRVRCPTAAHPAPLPEVTACASTPYRRLARAYQGYVGNDWAI